MEVQGAGLYGLYNDTKKEISLNNNLGDTRKLSTFIHELGHAISYMENDNSKKGTNYKEVEADIFNIMLNSKLGIKNEKGRMEHLQEHLTSYVDTIMKEEINNEEKNIQITDKEKYKKSKN